ncbi:MAG: GtrA family protein [Acutalibacteraceae bacterium]|nr:GtrA family protein [Acutalibacteraceae bacterium]
MSEQKMTGKQNFFQVVKFALFSASAGIIQTVADIVCNELIFPDTFKWKAAVSYLIALVLSVLWNFTFNRKFTFKSAANIPVAMLKVAAFYCIFTPLSLWWTYQLVDIKGINEYIILAGTMVINLVTEYLYCRFFVYKNSMNTAEKK